VCANKKVEMCKRKKKNSGGGRALNEREDRSVVQRQGKKTGAEKQKKQKKALSLSHRLKTTTA
jgi:hypothetical protein